MLLRPCRAMHRVYCAGPLFSAAERREMSELARALSEGGFETFLPHADGMEFANIRPYLIAQGIEPDAAGRLLHEAIFALDTYHVVEGCGTLLINLNGRVPDEGAVAEAAMAWMLGKPVLAYKDDARTAISGRDNPLVAGLAGFQVVRDVGRLADVLRAKLAAWPVAPQATVPCPPHLYGIFQAGEALWQRLCALGRERPTPAVAEIVQELFAATASPRRG